MRHRLGLLAVLSVVACASPSPDYLGTPRRDVVVDGLRFAVFRREDEAQVIRLDMVMPRDQHRVRPAMIAAAEQATGCRVRPFSERAKLPGDTGVIEVDLVCS